MVLILFFQHLLQQLAGVVVVGVAQQAIPVLQAALVAVQQDKILTRCMQVVPELPDKVLRVALTLHLVLTQRRVVVALALLVETGLEANRVRVV
jgi:hypothetical protein